MATLKILKRDKSVISNDYDYNSSVFRYFVESQEVKLESVKSGFKSAFLGMLDTLILNDYDLFDELSDWSFISPVSINTVSTGPTTTINIYTGAEYIYRNATSTVLSTGLPALRGSYTGLTYVWGMTNQMTFGYVLEPDLNKATHGIQGSYRNLSFFGGRAATQDVLSTTSAGYYAIEGNETPTHGKEGDSFFPFSYWDRVVAPPVSSTDEYTGVLRESKTGYTLDSARLGLRLTLIGEALERYNPIDLITFASLIKLQYDNRSSTVKEAQI